MLDHGLTVPEFCRRYRKGEDAVRAMIARGELVAVNVASTLCGKPRWVITPEAIASAVDNPRELDHGLVDAYQTRRVLDRLYGYEVSPVLWKKVMPRLSAGRVQSVATRLVVARDRGGSVAIDLSEAIVTMS